MTQPEEATAASAESPAAEQVRRRRPLWQRVLIGLGAAVVVIVALALALYNFGGMGSSANDPAMRQQYERLVESGEIAPIGRRFVIPIPGCTCHSTDPVQTQAHRYYRMKECTASGCHG